MDRNQAFRGGTDGGFVGVGGGGGVVREKENHYHQTSLRGSGLWRALQRQFSWMLLRRCLLLVSLQPQGPWNMERNFTWDPAGLAWHGKRPKAGNGIEMEIEMENGPKLDRGKNGKKMAQKWKDNGKLPQKSIFGPIFCHFCPCPAWGRFPCRFPFLFHFRLLAVFHAMPARQDPKTSPIKDIALLDLFDEA